MINNKCILSFQVVQLTRNLLDHSTPTMHRPLRTPVGPAVRPLQSQPRPTKRVASTTHRLKSSPDCDPTHWWSTVQQRIIHRQLSPNLPLPIHLHSIRMSYHTLPAICSSLLLQSMEAKLADQQEIRRPHLRLMRCQYHARLRRALLKIQCCEKWNRKRGDTWKKSLSQVICVLDLHSILNFLCKIYDTLICLELDKLFFLTTLLFSITSVFYTLTVK